MRSFLSLPLGRKKEMMYRSRSRRIVTAALSSPDYYYTPNPTSSAINTNNQIFTNANANPSETSFDPTTLQAATLLLSSSNPDFRGNLTKFLMEKTIARSPLSSASSSRAGGLKLRQTLVQLAHLLVTQTRTNCQRPRVEYIIEQSWIKSIAAAVLERGGERGGEREGGDKSRSLERLVSESLHHFHSSNRVLYIAQALYRTGHDLDQDFLLDLLDGCVCYFQRPLYPTAAAITVACSYPVLAKKSSSSSCFDLENELLKCIHKRYVDSFCLLF